MRPPDQTESSVELPPRDHPMPHAEEAGTHVTTLPPIDGGKDAWLALASAFVLEALVWGFPFSFGIFQTYYSTHEPFANEKEGIAAISTTATAIMFLSSPFVALFVQRWPHLRLPSGLCGLGVVVAGLVAASYCNSTSGLLATQGVLFAVGGLFLYFPAFSVIDQWFVARKGLAFGVVWTGTGVSGAIVPWVSQWLLDRYGFRTTLRVWAVVFVVLGLPCPFLLKARIPSRARHTRVRPVDWSFLKQPAFWWFEMGVILQSLAYFLPSLWVKLSRVLQGSDVLTSSPRWIPSFSASIGLPSFSGPLALCLLNLAACGGYLIQGKLVDHYHVTTIILLATGISTVAILIFWGLTNNQAMLYIFAILWGLSGGGFAATWAGCTAAIQKSCRSLDAGLVMSLLCAGKGVGSVLTGPISEKLLQVQPWHGAAFAYGGEYGAVIVFTGITAVAGGCACIGRILHML
ncbi:hypothetical protein LTR62_002807 [Meristemomyces frigidus]|uniref:MFS monocarboxylate transporter n=1 Tax=Meristemomyces frigidus TaxID=1508187 RepID=A0AAN7YJQ3_9PEZI|nr:hypothetical protein LTR62_002807 [Meristemomyces frigidus]